MWFETGAVQDNRNKHHHPRSQTADFLPRLTSAHHLVMRMTQVRKLMERIKQRCHAFCTLDEFQDQPIDI